MKHIRIVSNVCLFLLVLMVCACSEKNDGAETPIFPTEQPMLPVKPGETVTLEFSANYDWKLYSSALWCKFSNNLTSINGKAGDVSIPLTINEDTWSLDDEIAEISLKMGNEEMVIAKYSRAGFTATISDVNGTVYTEDNPLVFSYKNSKVENIINFSANFDWKIDEETLPEWIEIGPNSLIGGKAGNSINVMFNVPKKYWINSNSGTVTVKSLVSSDRLFIPVAYAGIPEGVVEVDGINGNPYWWEIAADGSYFAKEGSLDGSASEKIPFPFSFNVLAKDNAYKVLVVEQYKEWNTLYCGVNKYKYISLKNENNDIVEISSVAPNPDSDRNAYILLMNNDDYEEMMDKVEAAWGDYTNILLNEDASDLNSNYDKNVVLAFKQKAVVTPFSIVKNGWENVTCEIDTESEISKYISKSYKVSSDNICSINIYPETYLGISPKFENGEPTTAYYSVYYLNHSPVGDDIYIEGGEINANWSISLTVKESIYFIFNDGNMKKALIINVIQ